jgi:O-antigen/teichoic acid export membrane protein
MSISRDSLAYWISQVGNFGLSFVTSVFVAVILGPESRGVFVAVLLANTLTVSLSNLGVQSSAMYFVSKFRDGLARFHFLLLVIVLLISLLDLLVYLVAGEFLRERVFDGITWNYLAIALGALPFTLYFFAAQGVMAGLGLVRRLSRILFYYSFLANGLTLAALGLARNKLVAVLCVWALSQVLVAAALFAFIRREQTGWGGVPLSRLPAELSRVLSYGIRAFAGNMAAALTNRLDHLFILSTIGRTGIGIYSLSAKLAELVFQPSASLENAGYARVAGAGRDEAAALTRELFRTNFLINGSVMLIMLILSHPLVLFFYREEYRSAIVPLQILLPGTLFLSCSRMLALYFSAHLGRPQIPSAIGWIALAFNVPFMWWAVVRRDFGMAGAAAVTTSSYLLMLVCFLSLFMARTGEKNLAAFFLPRSRDLERVRRLARGVSSQGI